MDDTVFLQYRNAQGEIILVAEGLQKGKWMSMRRSNNGGMHRIKSPALPIRDSREEAQADLDAYAKKHGWRRWSPSSTARN